jgi:putative membrane protein
VLGLYLSASKSLFERLAIMSTRLPLLGIGLTLLSFLSVGASAQAQSAGAMNLDSEVLNNLHKANLTEISAAKMAKKQATTLAIKHYGEQLIQDDTLADEQVKAVAQKLKVTLAKVSEDKALENLSNLKGADFDATFTRMMVQAHDQAIQMVRDNESRVTSPDLSALLKELLPKLESNRATAAGLAKSS